ncbi:MAG: MFS transporter [Betaproteobacteria bacterium]|nr:MFS transporter [Betaproteobacteria bacterium]
MMFSAYSGVLPAVTLAWGMSASEAGAIQSAWHLGFLVSLFITGILADRIGARPVVLRSSLLAAVSAVAFAVFADDFDSAFLLYGFAGLCAGGTYTPALKLIFEEADPVRRGRAMGGYLAAGSVGYALALGSIALLVASGWRAGLLCAAAGGLVGCALVHLALAGMDDRRPAGAPPSPLRGMADLGRNPAAIGCIGAYTAHCWELLGMWAWLPAFVAASALAAGGADPATAVGGGIAVAALSHLVSAAGSVAGGTLSDRHGRAAVMMAATVASLACSLAFGWLYAAPLWVVAAFALVYNLAAIADSSVYSTALAEVVPARSIGAAYSLRSVTGFAAGALAPWLFGIALDAGRAWWGESTAAWALAWTSLAAGGIAGPFLIASYRRHAGRPVVRG